MSDPIADFLTRIRNAQTAGHRRVDVPASKLKRAMAKILVDKGYITKFINIDDGKQGVIRMFLKYDSYGKPVIRDMKRVSKPGLRVYKDSDNVPRSQNGLGVFILSTSKGVMTDKAAREAGIGGEIICTVF